MKFTRRKISQLGLYGLGGLSAMPLYGAGGNVAGSGLKILILGGTGHLGPNLVASALSRGHTVTLFNRGKTGGNQFPEVESLKGNRANDLKALKGRKWDVVVDTSAFVPGWVKKSVNLLKPNIGHYIYLSSVAVYSDHSTPNMDESAPTYALTGPGSENLNTFSRYGASKRECEKVLEKLMPERSMSIRSDTIVGPADHKHFRYTYWIRRATQDGVILGPGKPADAIQYVDARDLGDWIVRCAENSTTGTYNATSEPGAYTMEKMIQDCQSVAGHSASIQWVDTQFLLSQKILDIPFWAPNRAEAPATGHLSTAAAQKQGFKSRPKLVTAKDTYDWYMQLPAETQAFTAGVPLEQEQALLAAWNARDASAA